jgi:hypothetical protein
LSNFDRRAHVCPRIKKWLSGTANHAPDNQTSTRVTIFEGWYYTNATSTPRWRARRVVPRCFLFFRYSPGWG